MEMAHEFTGKHLLWLMIVFFGIVIAVNATMAVLAGSSWTGLIVKSSYVASQHYNERLEAARLQDELGWRSQLEATSGRLVLTMRTRTGEALAGLTARAKLARTVKEDEDMVFELEERGLGEYHADMALAPGLWLADVEAVDATGRRYERQLRIVIPAGE
jgi:nitrogen fixation protein FixH